MASRPLLPLDFTPAVPGVFLQRVEAPAMQGTFRVISDRMRRQFERVVPSATVRHAADGIVTLGRFEAEANGVMVGFYRDRRGAARHVNDDRADIEADRRTLEAAYNGVTQLDPNQERFMRRRVDLLDEFDAVVGGQLRRGEHIYPQVI